MRVKHAICGVYRATSCCHRELMNEMRKNNWQSRENVKGREEAGGSTDWWVTERQGEIHPVDHVRKKPSFSHSVSGISTIGNGTG